MLTFCRLSDGPSSLPEGAGGQVEDAGLRRQPAGTRRGSRHAEDHTAGPVDADTQIGELLPLAVGVAISPIPIIAVVLMLLSRQATRTSPGFLAGWAAVLWWPWWCSR
ncbi:GAP family protein [Kitasatospora sp. NPDC004615]|uniref:GAP family protein n=1 Tax=Kitasatospora sp. NPDC004615 TaxID=3364017 RepID=UPI0036A59CD7